MPGCAAYEAAAGGELALSLGGAGHQDKDDTTNSQLLVFFKFADSNTHFKETVSQYLDLKVFFLSPDNLWVVQLISLSFQSLLLQNLDATQSLKQSFYVIKIIA
jgi:hypothetical protein